MTTNVVSSSDARAPRGTVAFAFTDIEGSTVRWERDRTAMDVAVRRHDALLHAAIAEHGGTVFKTVGDAFARGDPCRHRPRTRRRLLRARRKSRRAVARDRSRRTGLAFGRRLRARIVRVAGRDLAARSRRASSQGSRVTRTRPSTVERATSLAGYAEATLAAVGFERQFSERGTYERLRVALAERLAADELARQLERGANRTSDAAIELAFADG